MDCCCASFFRGLVVGFFDWVFGQNFSGWLKMLEPAPLDKMQGSKLHSHMIYSVVQLDQGREVSLEGGLITVYKGAILYVRLCFVPPTGMAQKVSHLHTKVRLSPRLTALPSSLILNRGPESTVQSFTLNSYSLVPILGKVIVVES